MTDMLPGVFSIVLGGAFLMLGRWGMCRGDALVSPHLMPARREKEIRQIRRGSRSCVVLGGLFCVVGVALAISGATS